VAIGSVDAPRSRSSVARWPHERVDGSVNTITKLDTLALGAGAVLVGVGAAICLGAGYAFRSLERLNFLEHTRLVTEGIYRWSRNPQLVGWTLVLVGLGLLRGSAMVLFLAGLAWVSYRLHLPTEEEHLRRVFGDDYVAYQRRTHRYFGPPRPDTAE
jgi:protein-S-isoprenylcysteine O-methyltransferase Ste14